MTETHYDAIVYVALPPALEFTIGTTSATDWQLIIKPAPSPEAALSIDAAVRKVTGVYSVCHSVDCKKFYVTLANDLFDESRLTKELMATARLALYTALLQSPPPESEVTPPEHVRVRAQSMPGSDRDWLVETDRHHTDPVLLDMLTYWDGGPFLSVNFDKGGYNFRGHSRWGYDTDDMAWQVECVLDTYYSDGPGSKTQFLVGPIIVKRDPSYELQSDTTWFRLSRPLTPPQQNRLHGLLNGVEGICSVFFTKGEHFYCYVATDIFDKTSVAASVVECAQEYLRTLH